MWAIAHPPPSKNTKKTEYTTFPEKNLRLQIAIPAVCSLDFSYILTCKSVKLRKVQIKSEKLTPFGGIFSIMEQFDSMLSPIIDQTLGQRCSSIIGYQYSEIIRSLMSVYFCGGSCVEDVTSHLMRHLSYHPTLRTCSSDTILRAIKELTQENISYTSDKGKTYDFNTADKLNALLIKALVSTGELNEVDLRC